MSVIIKGLKMPQGCGKCSFCNIGWSNYYQRYKAKCCVKSKDGRNIGRTYNLDDFKPKWCPLEEMDLRINYIDGDGHIGGWIIGENQE